MTMLTLCLKEIADRRWYIIGGLCFFAFTAVMIPVSYRMVFPFLMISREWLDFREFVWQAWWGQAFWQLGYAFAFILGVNVFGREKEMGRMEFLLSRNVTRKKVLSAKLLIGAIIIWTTVVISSCILYFSALLSGVSFEPQYSISGITIFSCVGLLLPYMLAAAAVLFMRSAWKGFGICVIWLAIDLTVYSLTDGTFTLTGCMTDASLYKSDGFTMLPGLIVLFTAVVLSLASHWRFKRMEI